MQVEFIINAPVTLAILQVYTFQNITIWDHPMKEKKETIRSEQRKYFKDTEPITAKYNIL